MRGALAARPPDVELAETILDFAPIHSIDNGSLVCRIKFGFFFTGYRINEASYTKSLRLVGISPY